MSCHACDLELPDPAPFTVNVVYYAATHIQPESHRVCGRACLDRVLGVVLSIPSAVVVDVQETQAAHEA